MGVNHLDTLTRLLTQQQQFLSEYLQLTQAQAQLIAEENVEALTANLEKRAQIIGLADGLRPELDRLLALPGSAEAAPIQDLRQQLSRILQQITEIDQKNQAAVRGRMDFFQAEIRRVDDTRKGVGAYIKGAEIFSAEFVDERQ